jgi:5-carboxymethyl-2-hydroxymuconate isomerase
VSGKKQKIIAEVMEAVETTITEQFERRLAALEAHITDLEERLNARGVLLCDSDCPTHGRYRQNA